VINRFVIIVNFRNRFDKALMEIFQFRRNTIKKILNYVTRMMSYYVLLQKIIFCCFELKNCWKRKHFNQEILSPTFPGLIFFLKSERKNDAKTFSQRLIVRTTRPNKHLKRQSEEKNTILHFSLFFSKKIVKFVTFITEVIFSSNKIWVLITKLQSSNCTIHTST